VPLEQAPHGSLGVADSPLRLGDLEDPRDGPQIGGESVGERSSREKLGEGRQLLRRNEGGATGSRNGEEGLRPFPLDRAFPVAHRGGSDTQQSGDLCLRPTFGEETESLEASLLESGGVTIL
jgi:hypothetical protein